MTSSDSTSGQFKAFVSETELEEKRRLRQEEWEKVRRADQPLEAPEEEYDPRSLYDRLQEQKDKKQSEYEETYKLKNMVKGLEADEVDFLDLVDKTKEHIENQKNREEAKELAEFRKAVSSLAEENEDKKLESMRKIGQANPQTSGKRSQSALLAGAVKRKSTSSIGGGDSKVPKLDSTKPEESSGASKTAFNESGDQIKLEAGTQPATEAERPCDVSPAAVCIGVLPGVGVYTDSSDSDNSSNSDVEPEVFYDLLGRPLKVKQCYVVKE